MLNVQLASKCQMSANKSATNIAMRKCVPEMTKKEIRSVLLSKVGGVRIRDFQHDVQHLTGRSVDFRALGFLSLIELLESIPDVAKLDHSADGMIRVYGVAKENMFMNETAKKAQYKRPEDQVCVPPCKLSVTPSAGSDGKTVDVYIGNMPLNTTDEEINKLIERFKFIDVRPNKTERKRFAFVSMEVDEAERMVQALNHSHYKGQPIIVNCCTSSISTMEIPKNTDPFPANVSTCGNEMTSGGQRTAHLDKGRGRVGRGRGRVSSFAGHPFPTNVSPRGNEMTSGGQTTANLDNGRSRVGRGRGRGSRFAGDCPVDRPGTVSGHDKSHATSMSSVEPDAVEDGIRPLEKLVPSNSESGVRQLPLRVSISERVAKEKLDDVTYAGNSRIRKYDSDTYDLFIRGFPHGTRPLDLFELTQPHGAVRVDITNNQPPARAFGFVKFMDYELAVEAMLHLDGRYYRGMRLDVSFARNTFAPENDVMAQLGKVRCPVSLQGNVRRDKGQRHAGTRMNNR